MHSNTKPPRRWHLSVWAQQLEAQYEVPQGLFQRPKHSVMWFSVPGFSEELAFPFHPCKPFPLLPLPAVPLSFMTVVQDLIPFPSASLSTGFTVPDFQPSYGLDNSHFYFSILPAALPFPCCCFGIASSTSLWDLTFRVSCILGFFLLTAFLHCPFCLARYSHLAGKWSSWLGFIN